LISPINPNKNDDFHIHMDYVILQGFTEKNINVMIRNNKKLLRWRPKWRSHLTSITGSPTPHAESY